MAYEDGPGIIHDPNSKLTVRDPTGYFKDRKKGHVDLHRFFTEKYRSDLAMPIHTKEMRTSGLYPGGIALVSRARPVAEGSIVVVSIQGQTVVRRLAKQDGTWCLLADDLREKPFFITEFTEVERIGVVTSAHIIF